MKSTNLHRQLILIALFISFISFPACDSGSESDKVWMCEVSLTLVPSRLGNLSSPSGSGRGTGTGETQELALSQAYQQACSQLQLDGDTAQLCRQGDNFTVEGGGTGNIRLFSGVERDIQCGLE